jgi:hypothetical protein
MSMPSKFSISLSPVYDVSSDISNSLLCGTHAFRSDLELYNRSHGTKLQLRVGVNSGPLVGGYTGFIARSFDVWGDTVNVASRMESASLPGRINVSGATHALVGDAYKFEPRRQVDLKGKGPMWCYLLSNDAPEPKPLTLQIRMAKLVTWRKSMQSLVGQMQLNMMLRRWIRRARERIALRADLLLSPPPVMQPYVVERTAPLKT